MRSGRPDADLPTADTGAVAVGGRGSNLPRIIGKKGKNNKFMFRIFFFSISSLHLYPTVPTSSNNIFW